MGTLNFLGLFLFYLCTTKSAWKFKLKFLKFQKVRENSNYNSSNVRKCGRFKWEIRKYSKVREHSNWKSSNVKKCGKYRWKFLKCQKVREIEIEIPQMSKSAGNSNWKSSNAKTCGKFKLKFLKCQKVLENPNFFVLKMSNFAYCVLLGFYRFFLIASHSCMTCVTRSLFLKIPTENT